MNRINGNFIVLRSTIPSYIIVAWYSSLCMLTTRNRYTCKICTFISMCTSNVHAKDIDELEHVDNDLLSITSSDNE